MQLNYVKIYRKLFDLYNSFPYRYLRGFSFPPAQYFIGLTYDCNIDCSFCFSGRKEMLDVPEFKLEEVKKIIDRVPFYGILTLSGGEPLMYKHIWEVVDYASKNCKFTIVTNGTYNIEKNARVLVDRGIKSVFSNGLLELGVSLVGPEKYHDSVVQVKGAFSKTVAGLKRIRKIRDESGKKFPLISIRTAIVKENAGDLHEVVAIAKDVGADIVIFMIQNMQDNVYDATPIENYLSEFHKRPTHPTPIPEDVLRREFALIKELQKDSNLLIKFTPDNITEDEIVRYYSPKADLKNFTCRFPWQKIIYFPNGNAQPCLMLKTGNTKTESASALWNKKSVRDFRLHLKENGPFPICFGCCGLTYSPNSQQEEPCADITSDKKEPATCEPIAG